MATHGILQASASIRLPPDVFWDDEKYRGDAYGTFAWAVYVAEVTVDLTTCDDVGRRLRRRCRKSGKVLQPGPGTRAN